MGSKPLEELEAGPTASVPTNPFPASKSFAFFDEEDDADDESPRFGNRPLPVATTPDSPPLSSTAPLTRKGPANNIARMYTAEELALLPPGLLHRQKQKQLAKKAKKKRAAAGLTEAELMAGFVTMDVEERAGDEMDEEPVRLSKKQLLKEKKRKQKAQKVVERPTDAEMDAEARREADFANFLNTVGGKSALCPRCIALLTGTADDMDEEL